MLFRKNKTEQSSASSDKAASAAQKADKQEQQQPQVVQINLVDVVKQASMQMKYEEIGAWLMTHKTPLFWCHEKGFSIIDKSFLEKRPWLTRTLGRMVKEIEEQKLQQQQQLQTQAKNIMPEEKPDNTYIG